MKKNIRKISYKVWNYYDGKNTTPFFGKEVPSENVNCLCVDVIVLESVSKVKKNYCPEILVEKCKCKEKERKDSQLYW